MSTKTATEDVVPSIIIDDNSDADETNPPSSSTSEPVSVRTSASSPSTISNSPPRTTGASQKRLRRAKKKHAGEIKAKTSRAIALTMQYSHVDVAQIEHIAFMVLKTLFSEESEDEIESLTLDVKQWIPYDSSGSSYPQRSILRGSVSPTFPGHCSGSANNLGTICISPSHQQPSVRRSISFSGQPSDTPSG